MVSARQELNYCGVTGIDVLSRGFARQELTEPSKKLAEETGAEAEETGSEVSDTTDETDSRKNGYGQAEVKGPPGRRSSELVLVSLKLHTVTIYLHLSEGLLFVNRNDNMPGCSLFQCTQILFNGLKLNMLQCFKPCGIEMLSN